MELSKRVINASQYMQGLKSWKASPLLLAIVRRELNQTTVSGTTYGFIVRLQRRFRLGFEKSELVQIAHICVDPDIVHCPNLIACTWGEK